MKSSTWIIIGLAVVIAILLLFWPSPKEPDTQVWKDSIAKKDIAIQILNKDLAEIKKRLKSDSLEATKSKEVYEIKVKDLRSTVAKLKANPKVVQVRIENPEVDSLIIAQDSVIEVQEQRIAIQEYQFGKLSINVGAITDKFEQNLALERVRYEDQLKISETYQRDLKKANRKGKLSRVLIPVVGIGAFLLGSQL